MRDYEALGDPNYLMESYSYRDQNVLEQDDAEIVVLVLLEKFSFFFHKKRKTLNLFLLEWQIQTLATLNRSRERDWSSDR